MQCLYVAGENDRECTFHVPYMRSNCSYRVSYLSEKVILFKLMVKKTRDLASALVPRGFTALPSLVL